MTGFRNYTCGVSFYISPEMREALDDLSQEKRLPVSEIIREIIGEYLSAKSTSTSVSQK